MSILDMRRREAMATFEKEYLILHLYWNRGNVHKTAQALELTRGHLIRLIRKYTLYGTIGEMRRRTYILPKTWVAFTQPTPPDATT